MYCPNCGTEIITYMKICSACGIEFSPSVLLRLQRETDPVSLAREGDNDAFNQLYNDNYTAVLFAIRSVIRDEDTAMDILQDTFIQAFRHLDQLRDDAKFTPWIKTIAINQARNYLVKKKPILFTDISVKDEEFDDAFENTLEDDCAASMPEEVMEQKETARLIREIMDSLPDEQSITINLYYYDGLSVQEIAELMGIKESTVKSRMNYGRKKIGVKVKELEKQGTKLYGLAPLPFLLWLWKSMDAQAAEIVPSAKAFSAIMGKVGAAGAAGSIGSASASASAAEAAGSSGAASSGAASSGAAKAAKTAAANSVKVKMAAGITAAAVGVGGISAAVMQKEKTQIYAQSVVEFSEGLPWTERAEYQDTDAVLGEPDWSEEDGGGALTLGAGGQIILRFSERFSDIDGDDIVIYEVGEEEESVSVYVSRNGSDWYLVGTAGGGTSSLDMNGSVPEEMTFRYVKLVDNRDSVNNNDPGADIDAVGVYVMK